MSEAAVSDWDSNSLCFANFDIIILPHHIIRFCTQDSILAHVFHDKLGNGKFSLLTYICLSTSIDTINCKHFLEDLVIQLHFFVHFQICHHTSALFISPIFKHIFCHMWTNLSESGWLLAKEKCFIQFKCYILNLFNMYFWQILQWIFEN